MKKNIRILAACSMGIQLLSVLIYLVLVIFQHQFKQIMSSSPELVGFFVFPIAQTIQLALTSGLMILACLFLFSNSRSIWVEVVTVVLLSVVFAALYSLFGRLELQLLWAPRGSTAVASYSVLRSLTGTCDSIASFASSLMLVACGMSIAEKKLRSAVAH